VVWIVRALRGLLLTGPCRLYLLGQENGGAVPYLFLAAGAIAVAVCGGAGALWGLAVTADAGEGFLDGVGGPTARPQTPPTARVPVAHGAFTHAIQRL
jgi:hypothetical protein